MHLDLTCCHGLRDITPLSSLASLRTLSLCNCDNITTGIAALLACSSLRDLDIIRCEGIPSQDLASLAAWTQLESLVMPDGSRRGNGLPVAGSIPLAGAHHH